MKAFLPPRRLIPRWRRMSATLLLPEAQSSSKRSPIPIKADREDLDRAISEWKNTPNAGHLGDVLAFSIAADCTEVVSQIAREALASTAATESQKILIDGLLTSEGKESINIPVGYGICNPFVQEQVQQVRSLLRFNPSSPLVLLDFAQLQLASGKSKQAERSLVSALSLSPNNRLILRTLARYYVHAGEEGKAHNLIARHARTKFDSWLMASEIALAQTARVPSQYIKRGWKIAKDKNASFKDISELAGAVGGVELFNGNSRHARELFRIALLQPNDNVIAQAITDRRMLALDLTQSVRGVAAQSAAEAQTLLSWGALDAVSAEKNALRWHAEEPFSSRPLQFLASLLGTLGRYEDAIAIARRGIIADPFDASMFVSLSYSLACMGNLNDAEAAIRKSVSLDPGTYEGHGMANRGLIALKRLDFDVADQLYSHAVQLFEKMGAKNLVAICYAYYARAAFETGHPRTDEIVLRAVDLYKEAPSADAAFIIQKLQSDIIRPNEDGLMRRLYQWVYDPGRNVLLRKEGVTAPGAPVLLIKPKDQGTD